MEWVTPMSYKGGAIALFLVFLLVSTHYLPTTRTLQVIPIFYPVLVRLPPPDPEPRDLGLSEFYLRYGAQWSEYELMISGSEIVARCAAKSVKDPRACLVDKHRQMLKKYCRVKSIHDLRWPELCTTLEVGDIGKVLDLASTAR